MSMTVGKIVFSSKDLTAMFGQVEKHYLERIHALEEEVKEMKGCKCSEGYVGMIDEHCKSGS